MSKDNFYVGEVAFVASLDGDYGNGQLDKLSPYRLLRAKRSLKPTASQRAKPTQPSAKSARPFAETIAWDLRVPRGTNAVSFPMSVIALHQQPSSSDLIASRIFN